MDFGGNVVSMPEHLRRQLADVFREDDRLRAERKADDRLRADQPSTRNSEPAGAPYMQRNGGEAVLYRSYDGHAPAPAPAADDPWKDWNAWVKGHLLNERQVVAYAIGEVVADTRKEVRAEFEAALTARDRRIGMLEGELRELKGFVGGLLTVL